MQRIVIKGYTVTLDNGLGDYPRDSTNLGKIYSFGNRPFGEVYYPMREPYTLMASVEKSRNGVALPLYLNNCLLTPELTLDRVGFIHASNKAICKRFGVKVVPQHYLKRAIKALQDEIAAYCEYLNESGWEVTIYDRKAKQIEHGMVWGTYWEAVEDARGLITEDRRFEAEELWARRRIKTQETEEECQRLLIAINAYSQSFEEQVQA